MTVDADLDIRALLRAGDPQALATLYDRHGNSLYAYCRVLAGSEHEAEDLLHDVFIQVAERARQVATAKDLPAYLATMARNRCRDHQRRERATVVTTEADSLIAPVDRDDQTSVAVHAALARLPIEQREIVALKHWQDLTFAAIAEMLDISPDTAASRYRYARNKLEDALRELTS